MNLHVACDECSSEREKNQCLKYVKKTEIKETVVFDSKLYPTSENALYIRHFQVLNILNPSLNIAYSNHIYFVQ